MIPDSTNKPRSDDSPKAGHGHDAVQTRNSKITTSESKIRNQESGIQNQQPNLLLIESLEKRFGEVAVLRGVNVEIVTGSITAIVGPNGAGKTTLFHTISGDIQADRGAIVFNGRPLNGAPPWKIARMGLGKLFQDVRVFGNLSILENVLLATHSEREQGLVSSMINGFLLRKPSTAARDRASECMALAGVEAPWDRPARELSFGNQKLLALARLIAGDFQLLLLDEPTAGVAPAMAENMQALLQRIVAEQGKTILLIEHNFSFVQATATQTYLMRAGEIMDVGPTAQVLGKSGNREVLIGL